MKIQFKSYYSFKFIIALCIIIFFFPILASAHKNPIHAQERARKSEELKRTIITPTLNQKIEPGKNIIFCPTFQIAWNQLTDNILKGDLLMENAPPIVNLLNLGRKIMTKNELSPESYLAMAGFGKDKIIERINESLRQKFGDSAPTLNESVRPDDIIVYAFLFKNLKFATEFDDFSMGMIFGKEKETPVKSFGILDFIPSGNKMKALEKQVEILYYDEKKQEFIVKLIVSSQNDELVLARIEPEATLKITYSKARNMINKGKREKIEEKDILQVPCINFTVEHSYDEITGKKFKNPGFSDYYISSATQGVKFKLDKSGAQLKSDAQMIVKANGKSHKYRKLIFNRPFMLYLKEKRAINPYLILWIDNVELLELKIKS